MKKKNRIAIFAIILSLYTLGLAEIPGMLETNKTKDNDEQILVDETFETSSDSLNELTETDNGSEGESLSNEKYIFQGLEMNLGYVSKNMWAGFQFSDGPCIQSITKLSFWKISVGAYWNMMGSEEDRIKKSVGGYKTDKAARGFGMIDEVQFFVEGGHTWKRFALDGSIWLLAYSGDDSIAVTDTIINDTVKVNDKKYDVYNWWGKSTSAELTIRPSVQLGPITLFTEQNVVIFALEAEKIVHNVDDSTGNESKSTTGKGNSIGAYHGVFGATITKEVEKIDIEFTVKAEYAPYSFLESFIWSKKDREKEPSGIYHVTLAAKGAYSPVPSLKIDGFFNVQFMTNKDLDKAMGYDGCIPYGGLILTYLWDRK